MNLEELNHISQLNCYDVVSQSEIVVLVVSFDPN